MALAMLCAQPAWAADDQSGLLVQAATESPLASDQIASADVDFQGGNDRLDAKQDDGAAAQSAALSEGEHADPVGDGFGGDDSAVENLNSELRSSQSNDQADQLEEPDVLVAGVAADAQAAASSQAQGPIADGLYSIQSLVGAQYVLDVMWGSKNSGANVQIYSSNNTDAQKWKFAYLDGYYTITSVGSGKVLDVSGANKANGTNVQQYQANGTDAQLWKLVDLGGGIYTIASKLDPSFVLDVSGGRAGNGSNVQIYKNNKTNAQKWYLGPLGSLTSERLVEDGVYVVASALNNTSTVDINGGSYNNGANIQVYTANQTNAQRWAFTWDEAAKSYSIRNVANAKALDVYDGSIGSGANVHQFEWNGTNAQRWVIQKSGNYYVLRNVIAGLALDVSGASKKAGANVQVYQPNGTDAQKWTLTKTNGSIADGIYNIYTMLAPAAQVLELTQKQGSQDVQLHINNAGTSFDQKFKLSHGSGDVYTLQSVVTGKYLTAADGKIAQSDQASDSATKWKITFDANGLRIVEASEAGLSLKVDAGTPKAGTKVVLASNEAANNQLYRFQIVNLITDGYYIVRNAASDLVLDVSGGSYSQCANVQQYSANGSGAQVFLISAVGDFYRIMNARSHKVLDVTNGSKNAGANVQQFAWNGTGAQLWSVELDEQGQIVFVNKNSGLVLEVADASKADGANVRQNKASSDKKGQQWKLESTKPYSLSGDTTLDGYIADILGNHRDLYSAYVYVSNFTYRKGNTLEHSAKYLPDKTTISYAKEMVEVGSGNCYRFSCLFSWLARGLGYESNVVSGWVAGVGAPQAPHGWVEIYKDGGTYVCDPDMYNANRGINWYMQTYASAPIAYHFW